MTSQILVAEDDPLTLRMIEKTLTQSGFEVTTTLNGDDAITLGTAQQYDLVITDIQMPGTEGIEVISAILEEMPDTKFIAISSLGRTGFTSFLKIAEAVGAQNTLKKPFTPQDLLEAVKTSGIKKPHPK
ncbi:MAG: response regulator [Alphaproteobacteria bacterium]